MIGVEMDWESRTQYTSFKYMQFQTTTMEQLRLGFSPTETPFDTLQSWFMLQFMTMRGVHDSVVITPLLRFFYHNVLWEMGSSTKGEWMMMLDVHY
jgi:hypothetical protein